MFGKKQTRVVFTADDFKNASNAPYDIEALQHDKKESAPKRRKRGSFAVVNDQDYLDAVRNIELEQAAERKAKVQRAKDKRYAETHPDAPEQEEDHETRHNQNRVYGNPDKWNWLFPAFVVIVCLAAMQYFGIFALIMEVR